MAYTTINLPTEYFNTILYTGTGASNSVTGIGFQPDWVWIKGRSGATDHGLYDAVRGVQKDLVTNSTSAETTQTTGLTAFGTDGFTVGALAKLNTSAATYVAWNWLGANTTVSNTSGTITSTVSANTTAGFSIVSYTGTGSNATVGHGLGVAPKMIILKGRTYADHWFTWHNTFTSSQYIYLNLTNAITTGANPWNSTLPTSTLFSLGTDAGVNGNTTTYVAYCFAEVKGYSKFGKYTGNGNADGTFVYTGFKPAFVMWKCTDNLGENWCMLDNKRDTFNLSYRRLNAESSGVETSGTTSLHPIFDMLSNGFKHRGSGNVSNGSSNNYIYMAFAESPFVSSAGIPTTAR